MQLCSGGVERRCVLGPPLALGVGWCAAEADPHQNTVAHRALQLSQHPQHLSVGVCVYVCVGGMGG